MTIQIRAHASVIFDRKGVPSITGVTPGDTECVIAVTANAETDDIYARYRLLGGSWSSENVTFSRTGSGNITITGLTNDRKYQFAVYAKSDAGRSDWEFSYGTPVASSVSPTGMLSLPKYYLKQSLANSSNFQSMTDSEDATEALTYLHDAKITNMTPPWAVVDWSENFEREMFAGGTHDYFKTAGALFMVIRGEVEDADDSVALMMFENRVGAILQDIEDRSGTAGYLAFQGVSKEYGPVRPSLDKKQSKKDAGGILQGDYFETMFVFEFKA